MFWRVWPLRAQQAANVAHVGCSAPVSRPALLHFANSMVMCDDSRALSEMGMAGREKKRQASLAGRGPGADSDDDSDGDDRRLVARATAGDPFFEPEADPFSDAFFNVSCLLATSMCRPHCCLTVSGARNR